MQKYFVIATIWDSDKKKQVETIIGEFDKFHNAKLFKESYNNFYHATSHIKESTELLNIN